MVQRAGRTQGAVSSQVGWESIGDLQRSWMETTVVLQALRAWGMHRFGAQKGAQ